MASSTMVCTNTDQLIDVAYVLLVHTVFKTAPNSEFTGAVRWPEVGRDEFWHKLTEIFHSGTCTVSWRTSCWKTNRSPANWRSTAASVVTAGCYALSILTPGSTKINSVQPSLRDTTTFREGRPSVRSRRSAAMSRFLVCKDGHFDGCRELQL